MTKTQKKSLAAVVGLALCVAAFLILRHELRAMRYRDVVTAVQGLRRSDLLLAVGLVAFGYLALTVYDLLALHSLGRRLSYWRIALASFVGYTFSHNIGFAAVSGTSVRFRLYSDWGFSAKDIARIVLFTMVTFWLGFLGLLGCLLLIDPHTVPDTLRLPVRDLRPLGVLCLALLASHHLLAAFRRKPLRVGSFELPLPTSRVALAQTAASLADWLCAGTALYVLLRSGGYIQYPHVMIVFLVAHVAGFVSQVPGGLGVFESVVLGSLSPVMPGATVLAALLAFRVLYYLLPFALGALLLVTYEVRARKQA